MYSARGLAKFFIIDIALSKSFMEITGKIGPKNFFFH
jgi:hypothetical protein